MSELELELELGVGLGVGLEGGGDLFKLPQYPTKYVFPEDVTALLGQFQDALRTDPEPSALGKIAYKCLRNISYLIEDQINWLAPSSTFQPLEILTFAQATATQVIDILGGVKELEREFHSNQKSLWGKPDTAFDHLIELHKNDKRYGHLISLIKYREIQARIARLHTGL